MTQETGSRPLTLGPVMPGSLYEDRGYRSRDSILEEGRAAARLVLENTLPQEGLLAAAATSITDQPDKTPVRLSVPEGERAKYQYRLVGEASTFCLFSEIPTLRPDIPVNRKTIAFQVDDDIFEADRPTNVTNGERLGREVAGEIARQIMETLVNDLRSLGREVKPVSDSGLSKIVEIATINQRSRNGLTICLANPKTWVGLTSHLQHAETNGSALEKMLGWSIPVGAVITCGDLRAGLTVIATPPAFTSALNSTKFVFEVSWAVTGPDFFTLFALPPTEGRPPE